MNAQDILTLVNAGFSKEEILALNTEPKEAETPEPEPAPEPAPAPAPVPAPAPAQDERYNELLEAMNKLTGAIQAGNILRSENEVIPDLSAEDVLAQVVSPQLKPKGGRK